jgi:hypothetical protein
MARIHPARIACVLALNHIGTPTRNRRDRVRRRGYQSPD